MKTILPDRVYDFFERHPKLKWYVPAWVLLVTSDAAVNWTSRILGG